MSSTNPPATKGSAKGDPLVGTVVNGKFKVASLVASGGMGKIYRAEQMPLQRPVALKVLHAHASGTNADDPQFKKRFLREASILARLQHPNIVTVFDYGAIEGSEEERYFMAMEFLSGETLARRITDRLALPVHDTIKIARQIARGLVEAHGQGVIHRDLKPSNVMLVQSRNAHDGEELVKIVDFGIVKIVGDESMETEELTQEGSFIGSPKYMAPEQIQRGGKVDVRTDVYSFGIILYQCLCGSVPFDGASSIQTLMAHLNQAPQPLRERAPALEIPAWLEHLVMTYIEKDPSRRPQAMDVVARALTEAEAVYTTGQIPAGRGGSGPHTAASFDPLARRSGSFPDAPGPASARGLRASSGSTEQGTISSVRPGEAESEKTRTSPGTVREKGKPEKTGPTLLLIAGGAIAAVALVFFFLSRKPPPVTAVPAPPATATAKREFAMTIDSTPPGAEVREGDRVLGTTPLRLTIDNDGARLEPRRFTVTKDGYVAYSLMQGPSQDPVKVMAALAPSPAAAPPPATPAPSASPVAHGGASPRRAGTSGGAAPRPTSPASAAPSSNNLDIRLTR